MNFSRILLAGAAMLALANAAEAADTLNIDIVCAVVS